MIEIRNASTEDAEMIASMLAELEYPTNTKAVSDRLELYNEMHGYGVLLCLVDSEPAGFLAWSKSHLFVLDKVRFHIEAIFVSKPFRKMGCASKLMHELEDIAKEEGASTIDLTSGVRRGGSGTHDFYNKLGYKNEGHFAKLYFRKEI